MAKVKAGSTAGKILKNAGASYLFGIPGGHIYPLMEGCKEESIPFISMRNEMNAAFAAEGWALATGKLGLCTGTAGPGVTNLLTGMANASCGSYPVFYFGGRAKLNEFDRNLLQDFEQLPVVSSMCKYAKAVYDPLRIQEYVQRAAAEAISGRPGPVYLEMPRCYMEEEVEEEDLPQLPQVLAPGAGRAMCDCAELARAAALIDKAERPLIIIGGGAWWSQAQDALKAFVEKTGIPFFTRNAARGIISDFHPLYGGLAYNHPVMISSLYDTDLIIVAGTRTGYTLSSEHFSEDVPIIRIDIDPAEITSMLDIEVPLVGDVRTVIEQLTEACEEADHSEWVAEIKDVSDSIMEANMDEITSDESPAHPLRLMAEIAMRADEDTVFVLDGGDVATWAAMALPATGPGQYMGIPNTSFGPLGVGMGYAIAAKLAHPDKKVILVTGDGAFGYYAMEYETCIRYGIDITTIILNDKQWGMILRSEANKAEHLEPIGLQLQETHYEEVVKALGGYGEYVDKAEDIGEAIDRALEAGVASCVNVMTDPQYGPPRV